MLIALDHDGTFTLCPGTWAEVIKIFRSNGAAVICISSRFPNVPIIGFPGDVYYTCGQPKWEWAYENGINVDVWIDDMPHCIGEHPERRGQEPGQAKQRREIVKQVFDHWRSQYARQAT